ncbi:MAG: transposase, partial [Endomicrobium sp.]|nr:transposase [Endomicrobium sp.]
FNGKLRDEFLNSNIFSNMQDLREKLESWSTDYNTQRPHSAIGNLSSREFIKQQKRDLQKDKNLNLRLA